MDFQLTKDQELIQKAAKEYAEKSLMPIADKIAAENRCLRRYSGRLVSLVLVFRLPKSMAEPGLDTTVIPGIGADCPGISRCSNDLFGEPLGASAINALGLRNRKQSTCLTAVRAKNRLICLHRTGYRF